MINARVFSFFDVVSVCCSASNQKYFNGVSWWYQSRRYFVSLKIISRWIEWLVADILLTAYLTIESFASKRVSYKAQNIVKD